MARDNIRRTPQEYEILSGGGAEAAELGRQGKSKELSRRQMLRRAVGITAGVVGLESVALGLVMFYPNVTGGFGDKIKLKKKTDYPAAMPQDFSIEDGRGVFYEAQAKSYIVHLAAGIPWVIGGSLLDDLLTSENIVKDSDGSYWMAIYQRCVHLGCKFNFNTSCRSFKCPCHGSHYNVDGEWLSGPAPKSNDRFPIDVNTDTVIVDTGKVNIKIQRPSASTRLLQELAIQHGCD